MKYSADLFSGSDHTTQLTVHMWQPSSPNVSSDQTATLWCAHGLTRSGLDFELLAQQLVDRLSMRVIAPDTVGRGSSQWLADKSLYHLDRYAADTRSLWKALDLKSCSWLGTSMGGLLALRLLSQGVTVIEKLLLNDVGTQIEPTGLNRIGSYLGRRFEFSDWESAEAHHRQIMSPFGRLSDSEWHSLAQAVLRPTPGGAGWSYAYDPDIVKGQAPWPQADDLWRAWEGLDCPTLVLRGSQSDILSQGTLGQMLQRNPKARGLEIANVGHAPTFTNSEQADLVADWFSGSVLA